MRNRYRLVLVIVGVAVASSLGWEALRSAEPEYHRKKLSEWLDEYNTAGSFEKTEPASDAIRAMGTNCLPFLLANIKHRNSPLKQRFLNLVGKLHLVRLPFYKEDPHRYDSILALRALGSVAAPLYPELLKLAEDSKDFWLGSTALLAIGPESIPTLAKVCESSNEDVRIEAILRISMLKSTPGPRVFWGWGKDSLNGRPILGLVFAVWDQDIRAMVEMLEDRNAALRRASAEAIGHYAGPAYKAVAQSAIAPLIKALNDTNADVRISAGKTLKIIDPAAAAKVSLK
jgi:hypothetical protein